MKRRYLLALLPMLTPACSPKSTPEAPKAVDTAPQAADTAPQVADAAPQATDAAPQAADTAPQAADAAPQGEDAEAKPEAKPVDLATLGDGIAESREMLEAPAFDDAARLDTFCDRALARAEAYRGQFRRGEVQPAQAPFVLNRIFVELDTLEGYISLHFNVNPSAEVREMAGKCRTKLSKFSSDLSLDRAVYEALAKAKESLGEAIDAVTAHYLDKTLESFVRAGVDKDEATRARISEINLELTELGQDYQKTVNGDTRTVVFTDEAMLDGLPDDWKAAHPKNDAGEIAVTTDYPDLMPFLTYASNADARRQLQAASAGRGYPKNGETLKRILVLRAELARLVGFPNFAALDLADKMAGTTETVEAFIKEASEAGKPRLEKDLELLLARMKKDNPDATQVLVSDRLYLINQVRSERFDYDAKAVREYFQYTRVKDGIFALYGELFGLEFARLEGAPVWHPAVEAWELRKDGTPVGRFYLDNHPRADKYKHAAMFPLQTGTLPLEHKVQLGDETVTQTEPGRMPWASLVCNFPNPAEGDALMEHGDVVTFFHEFGHLIHHLLANQSPWLATSGINVEWDFVEAPSQLMEDWAWDAQVLARFAKNAKGKAIPPKLVERMRAASELGKGADLARQLFYAAYSFYLHTADAAALDLDAFTDELYQTWSPYPRPDGDRLYANFAHLVGYKSAYYTYQWSLAIAKDLLGPFQAAGLMNQEVATAYRTKILEPAATRKAHTLIEDFLGRPRNLDAYRAWISR